jgi:ornithine--oxo-acid transaminase
MTLRESIPATPASLAGVLSWNLENNLVRDVMTSSVVSVEEPTPFKQIVDTLAQNGISAVPVIDRERRVLGIVSESDLLTKVVAAGRTEAGRRFGHLHPDRRGQRKSDGETAGELMSSPAVTISADAPVVHAAREAALARVRRMPVVDSHGLLVGIITRSDLLRVYLRSDNEIKDHIEELIAGQFTLDQSAISCDVSSGIVTLRGHPEGRIVIAPLMDAVAATTGVVGVHDKLTYRIDEPTLPSPAVKASPTYENPEMRGPDTLSSAAAGTRSLAAIADAETFASHNYHPLPVVISEAEGAWVCDLEGIRYLDLLGGYSALSFGHRNPALINAAHRQLDRVTLTSRAFYTDQLGAFCRGLTELCGMEMALPMNTGAEAVETAIKAARKWGYQSKKVPEGRAKIVVMAGNFHGRTTTIISFSDDPDARADFGPFTPGFVIVPYGDAEALCAAIDDDVVAVLVEPIQGEAGVVIPPEGYLRAVRALCDATNVLMIADEIQSGLGRTGRTFACDHENVVPDVYVLGKALGGGVVPVSAVVSRRDVLGLFRPGQHGSTFGGNPLACAVGLEVLRLLETGEYQHRAATLGVILREQLEALPKGSVSGVRTRGLWAGIDVLGRTGRDLCEGLLARRVLAKDTHGSTIRLAPPLSISEVDLRWALDQLHAELLAAGNHS